MTTTFQRFLSLLIVLLLGAQMISVGIKQQPEETAIVAEEPLLIWYTDPDIQPYMERAAREASVRYRVEVRTELVSEVDYIENISKESVKAQMEGPDLYVVSSALLEKAVLAGLARTVTDTGLEMDYSQKAVQAVSYDGKIVARPFYIETCFMLYNRNYVTEEQVPDTIEDILTYAENFETGESNAKVEHIFKWNVADVVEDYMFLGAYMELGGPSGDDKAQVSIDIEKAEACMAYYQSLNEFFAIDADTVNSEEVIQEFVDGKIVFTIANVPMFAALEDAVDGDPFYEVMLLPELTEELDSRGVSVTNSVVVNPYTSNVEAAENCARYLTESRVGNLYAETGKIPAYTNLPAERSDAHVTIYKSYEQAAEVPKIMELSNMWLRLEVVLADIWRGSDAGEALDAFREILETQLD